MGAWEEIQDNTTVQGFLKPEGPGEPLAVIREDGDWTFSIEPGERFQHLLTNPSGQINSNRLIECEIEPADDIAGQDAEDPEVAKKYLYSFKNDGLTWFTINGDWVIDTDHDDKTEIHPITSIFVEQPLPADNKSRVVDFLVFSDDSSNLPDHVFHSYEDRIGMFDIPVPWGPNSTGG